MSDKIKLQQKHAIEKDFFRKNILDDLLSGGGVMACGEPTFPAAVLPFSDVALAVCSFLSHSSTSLVAHNTTTEGVE